MIYIIDHQDSFTHNIVHQFSSFNNVECDNFDKINQKKMNKAEVIVFFTWTRRAKRLPCKFKNL